METAVAIATIVGAAATVIMAYDKMKKWRDDDAPKPPRKRRRGGIGMRRGNSSTRKRMSVRR